MAKKRNVILEGPAPFDRGKNGGISHGNDEMSELDSMKLMFMTTLAEMGVTAEEYAAFLNDDKLREEMIGQMDSMAEDFDFHREAEEVYPIPDANKKSLRLKVQMKDVNKPPMWREVVIPADFNFSQLHQAIQAATGLDDCHLWQFQRHAYDRDLQIGIPCDDGMGFGIEEWTHDADVTPVTGFLAQKGDKLEYVYDFGDDWIFTVSVLDVVEREGDVAVCTKWKCDFQPIEDCGGVWSFLQIRDAFSDPKALTAKQKRELADSLGFEDFKQLSAYVDDSMIDIEYINERLADITESGRRDD